MTNAAELDQRWIEHSILFPIVQHSHCLWNSTFNKDKILNFPWYILQFLPTKYLRTLWAKSCIQSITFNRHLWAHPPKMYQTLFWIHLYLASTAPSGKGLHILTYCTETQEFVRVLQ